jgi:tight adherence protein B
MWLPAVVFVAVMALTLGLYYIFVVRDEARLRERLEPRTRAKRAMRGVLKADRQMSSVGLMQRILEEVTPLSAPIRRLLEQSGVRMTVGVFVLLSAVIGLSVYLVVETLTASALLGVAAGGLVSSLPLAAVRRIRDRRLLRFEEHFPEAIDLMARALRAGHALPTGIEMVADELPAPVGTEFRTLFDEQNFGLALHEAMRNFARRVPVLDARFFVTAVLTQREAGGNLAEVLDNLSSVIRERFKIKRQVRVISAHGRITGWILALLPPALAVATLILNPAHLGTLLRDPLGVRMLVVAGIMQIVGTLIVRRIVEVEY